MLGLILAAAILGIIIAVMERDEFPCWGNMVICVLAAGIPQSLVNLALPKELFFIGVLAGAVGAMVAIMATCGMGPKRAAIAAGIYFGIDLAISLALTAMVRA